ncbi:hypothetical protein [Dyadobacter arcticus]|uniref:Uncharacterized protein n=1 Tax=Dyadobacter arcticus TaxID=1078754 RepID=A0ABX0ULM8_9BACT|nr:hypothetical protein [Dyadobacter arcticus]NIJ52869.1 hypothetical protein [Dyadobacter arcticus]
MKDEAFYNKLFIQFGQFTIAAMFIPVVAAMLHYRLLDKASRIFLLYLSVIILVNLIEQAFIWSVNNQTDLWRPFLTKFEIGDTNFLGILSFLTDFIFLGLFFSVTVVPAGIGKWIGWASVLLALIAVVDYFWITGYNATGVFTPTLDGIFASLLPLIQLGYMVRQDYKVSIYKIPYFWFSSGLIVTHLLALLFYLAGDKIYDTDFPLYVKLYLIGNCLNIASQILYAIGFRHARTLRYI